MQYIYDGEGNRVQQVDYTGTEPITTTYTNDNSGLSTVLVAADGATTTHNLVGLSLISQDDGAEVRTLLADGLGSARIEMVGSTVEAVATYEPFGKLLARTGETGTVYGYAGEQFDAANGLVYLRARYYAPDLKLFMSRDPFPGWQTLPASQHPYTYSHNNPVNFTDPTGRSIATFIARTCTYPWLCVAGAAVVVYVVITSADVDLTTPLAALLAQCADIVFPPNTRTRPKDDGGGIALPREGIGPVIWTNPRTETVPDPGPKPTWRATEVPPIVKTPTPQPQKKVLIVGDGNFSYSINLAAAHPNWEITGTNYGDGSNSQTLTGSDGNLSLYTNVDATRLESGPITGGNQYDAIVFNAPRAETSVGFYGPAGDLVEDSLRSAQTVLSPGGHMRFSSTTGMPAGRRLQKIVQPQFHPAGYSNAYKGSLFDADPEFGVRYIPLKNNGTPLEVDWNKMYWWVFVK